jgi:hypothetical protein
MSASAPSLASGAGSKASNATVFNSQPPMKCLAHGLLYLRHAINQPIVLEQSEYSVPHLRGRLTIAKASYCRIALEQAFHDGGFDVWLAPTDASRGPILWPRNLLIWYSQRHTKPNSPRTRAFFLSCCHFAHLYAQNAIIRVTAVRGRETSSHLSIATAE